MNVIALAVAFLSLVAALAAIVLAARAGARIKRYTIRGRIFVNNDCDGRLDSLPDQVRVEPWLDDARGQSLTGGQVLVTLRPAPAGTAKQGSYRITVPWDRALFGPPQDWIPPKATLPDRRDICRSITSGCDPGFNCTDVRPFMTPAPPSAVPFMDPVTDFDLDIMCGCFRPS